MTETAAPPYRCPTPCDDDCEINGWGCHECHDVPTHREHDPEACEARMLAGNLRWLLDDGWLIEIGHTEVPRKDMAYWVNVRRMGDPTSVRWSGATLGEAVGPATDGNR